MKREIKFRARNAELPPCWIYGYFVIKNGYCLIINADGEYKVIAGSECEYTGLCDKNGKEIYEGDIVKVSPDEGNNWDKGSIKYGSYASFVIYLPQVGTGISSPLLNFCVGTMGIEGADIYIEVIGNIYENGDLSK